MASTDNPKHMIALEEDEGIFNAVNATERLGPYPSRAEAAEAASRENARCGGTLFTATYEGKVTEVTDLVDWKRERALFMSDEEIEEILFDLIGIGSCEWRGVYFETVDSRAIEIAAEDAGIELDA